MVIYINIVEFKVTKMHYVYIVICSDNTLYTGYTTDINKRLKCHNDKKGAKYTRGRTPVKLRYYEKFDNKHDALIRESCIKKLPREKKLELIRNFYI